MRTLHLIFVLVCLTVFAFSAAGCVIDEGKPVPPVTVTGTADTEPGPTCPSCDDSNICTEDACSAATGYACIHTVQIPCCGDSKCQANETGVLCPADCIGSQAILISLVAGAEKVKSSSYDFDDGKQTIHYTIKGNAMKLTYAQVQRYTGIFYDTVLINTTKRTAYIYCETLCGASNATSSDYAIYNTQTPVDIIKSIASAEFVGTETLEGNKPSTVIRYKDNNQIVRLSVWTIYGFPIMREVLGSEGNVIQRTRYSSASANYVKDEDVRMPPNVFIVS